MVFCLYSASIFKYFYWLRYYNIKSTIHVYSHMHTVHIRSHPILIWHETIIVPMDSIRYKTRPYTRKGFNCRLTKAQLRSIGQFLSYSNFSNILVPAVIILYFQCLATDILAERFNQDSTLRNLNWEFYNIWDRDLSLKSFMTLGLVNLPLNVVIPWASERKPISSTIEMFF